MIDLKDAIHPSVDLPDEMHRNMVLAIREESRTIAGKLQRGEALSRDERLLAADLIVVGADHISTEKLRGRGRRQQIAEVARTLYAVAIVHEKKSQNAAITELAERYGVSVAAMKKFLGLTKGPKQQDKQRRTEAAIESAKRSHWIVEER